MWFDPLVRSTAERTDAAIRAHSSPYYDAVPAPSTRVEDYGSLSLFVSASTSLTYYGRPTLGHDEAVAREPWRRCSRGNANSTNPSRSNGSPKRLPSLKPPPATPA